jgi:3-oxoacyl-[acyl-carrier protein] reductase
MSSAIVTGAAQGIGSAIARRLGQAGQPVVVAGRTRRKVLRAQRSLAAAGIEVTGVTADVLSEGDVIRLVDTAIDRYGGIQALINNAAIYEEQHVLGLTARFWDTTMGINLRGALLCAREAARHMDSRGRIVNISSMSGLICERGFAAYNASKAGLISLTKSLAVDLADRGIMVNCVAPGWVLTPMTEEYLATVSKETMLRINLLGRAGTPEEIAEVVAFFARPDVTYLTGQTVFVDGGQTVRALLPEDLV